MTTETTQAVFYTAPIAEVRESRTNPRKHFDEASMKELVDSVKEKGILVPILARRIPPDGGNGVKTPAYYEVVAGARRYRAAKAAGLKEVPLIVRDLTDEQALEAQVIENLQRADVHPLDEAEGYAALMRRTRQDVAAIAAKVGKSASYVYQRLKLAELVDAGKKAFWAGKLTAGHAVLIARLRPEDQKEVLEWYDDETQYNPIGVRELASHIESSILTGLNKAPWNKADGTLVPQVGPCTTCPKRSGAAAELFDDIAKGDRCLDRGCFATKLEAHMTRLKKRYEESGWPVVFILTGYGYQGGSAKPAQKPLPAGHWHELKLKNDKKCDKMAKGIFWDGNRRGQAIDVCTGMRCPIHSGYVDLRRDPKEVEREKREETKHDRERELTEAVLRAAVPKAPGVLSREILERVAYLLGDGYHTPEVIREIAPVDTPKKFRSMSDRELAQHITAHAMAGQYGDLDGDAVLRFAKAWEVPVDQIRAELQAKWKEEDAREAQRLKEKEAKGEKKAAALQTRAKRAK